ncbi:hypothetical protein PENTCL1PPCAC_25180 [Pristionchus entomophagus]|uniref:Secreted protein n=1 Tax=Pristionchus entomophagus TaxID=358040 RepID=A0AAV5U961_9BILA|nr:hypothetical protein PENTCL1PPCAC_25180 [Pristionchus entomophagus]
MKIRLRSLSIFIMLPALSMPTATVRCYPCVTPWNGDNFDRLCTDRSVCEGIWCTKGSDELSSGILHARILFPWTDQNQVAKQSMNLEESTSTVTAITSTIAIRAAKSPISSPS